MRKGRSLQSNGAVSDCNRSFGAAGWLFRRSLDILDTYYAIKQFSNVLEARRACVP